MEQQASKCNLTIAQVAELYIKQEPRNREKWERWAKEQTDLQSKGEVMFVFDEKKIGGQGFPWNWQFKTVDTGRWATGAWKEVHFHSLPPQPNKNVLFEVAKKVLSQLAVPSSLLLSGYERNGFGLVLAVDCSLIALSTFISYQQKEKLSPEESTHLRSLFESSSKDKELYRKFSLAILKIRHENDLANIILYSLKDQDYFVCVFRDFDLFDRPFYRTMPNLIHKEFLSWPLIEHPETASRPEILCERPNCSKSSGYSTNNQVMEAYKNHKGPRERSKEDEVIQTSKKFWRENLEPQLVKEIEQEMDEWIQNNSNKNQDETQEKRKKVTEEKIEKYSGIMDEKESSIRNIVHNQDFITLKKCGKCKLVGYCSRECQELDWSRHKTVCKAR